ncbi:hypothetical protein [Lacticaseibacillus casei]|uniref:hypothetical protein n=1 Tax=Lacticaseibacillus casei TaxID=1582 RepID=UPI0014861AEB|nr:hypothetical protein [Lacticaseibacillus casei]
MVIAKRIKSIAVTIDFALVDANFDLLFDLLGVSFLICVRDGRQTINILYQMVGSEAKLAG